VLASFLGWRRAPLLRHAADVVQAVALICVILPIGVPAIGRVQGAMVAACAPGRRGELATPAECEARAGEKLQSCTLVVHRLLGEVLTPPLSCTGEMMPVHLLMLVLNIIMFAADVAKFVSNRGAAAATKDKAI